MPQFAMMMAPGARGDAVGRALERALTGAGIDVTAGPADPGKIVIEQLSRGEPLPDGLIWSGSDAGGVVRVYPRGRWPGSRSPARRFPTPPGGGGVSTVR